MHKQNRLKSSKSFDYIYRHGASYKNGLLVLFVVKSKIKEPKVGFSVGKKVGGSVERNKTKRRLREAFYKVFPSVKKGYNYVVVARSSVASASFEALSAALSSLLSESGSIEKAASEAQSI